MSWQTRQALKRELIATRTALHLLQVKNDDLQATITVLEDVLGATRRQCDALTATLNDMRRHP